MTTGQVICLAAIAAIVVIYTVGQVTRPRVSGDDILKAVTTAIIMARDDNRYLSLKISDRGMDIFCGAKEIGDVDEPQADDREPVL